MVYTVFLKFLRVMGSLKFSEVSTAHTPGGLVGMEHSPTQRGVGGPSGGHFLIMDAKWFGLRLF